MSFSTLFSVILYGVGTCAVVFSLACIQLKLQKFLEKDAQVSPRVYSGGRRGRKF